MEGLINLFCSRKRLELTLLRHTGSGRLIAAGCESTDIATDKALAGEVISCSGSFKICDEAVITVGQLASLKRYTTKEKTNRLVGREWS